MRYLTAGFAAVAVVVLAVGSVCAQGYQNGMYFIQLTNAGNGHGDGSGPAFQPGGWTATTNGALWIKTGSAAPILNTQDVCLQLDFRTASAAPWTTITGAYILGPSNQGPAFNDVATTSYPGYWFGCDGDSGYGNSWLDATSPYRMTLADAVYYLPGTLGATLDQQKLFQFDLYAWTGPYATYNQAVAGGACVAHSGAFQATGLNSDLSGLINETAFVHMPSLVLTQSNRFPGDTNLDGVVNIADLSVLLTNFDKTGMTWSQGDFDGNGAVDIADLSQLLTNFDKTATAAAGLHAVPEPSTLMWAVAVLVGLAAWIRRKRS
jgi:hypothetical protein